MFHITMLQLVLCVLYLLVAIPLLWLQATHKERVKARIIKVTNKPIKEWHYENYGQYERKLELMLLNKCNCISYFFVADYAQGRGCKENSNMDTLCEEFKWFVFITTLPLIVVFNIIIVIPAIVVSMCY